MFSTLWTIARCAGPAATFDQTSSTLVQPSATPLDTLMWGIWIIACGVLLYLAALPVDLTAQMWIAGSLLLTLVMLRRIENSNGVRILFLFLAAFLSLRYFFWRTFSTLSYTDFFSYLAALALYLAEVYGITIYLLGIFVNIHPLHRPLITISSALEKLPTVDILIPTYNEPPDLLEITLRATVNIRYPREKYTVHLLDDGGTWQKRTDPDPEKMKAAQRRQRILQALCAQLGVQYLTRDKNEHAKAGNINAALQRTSGELILILDADHVPAVDILEKTVGWFERDSKIFLVQTPHFFISPDPIEKNLETFAQMPSENEMFYQVVQRGLDFWNASFFCGSAALLRRKALEEIGGICQTSITEDAETALALHARGWKSVYVHYPLIAGLQPESFSDFILQRTRWAQGMMQIFLLQNPLTRKGLELWQRLCYFNNTFFWFFSYARLIFLLAPSVYLLFGLKIYHANGLEIIGYAIPHVLGTVLVSHFLFGKVRWPFISELYELIQSLFSLRAISKVFLHPRTPTFLVTPKGNHRATDFISPLSGVFYLLFGWTVAALMVGGYRYLYLPLDRDIILITMGWEVFNLLIVTAAIGALLERRQRRSNPRMPAGIPAELLVGKQTLPCIINDIAAGGASLLLNVQDAANLPLTAPIKLHVYNTALRKQSILNLVIRNQRTMMDQIVLGVQFIPKTDEEISETVALAYGDSARWYYFLQKRETGISILKALLFLLTLGIRHAASHFQFKLRTAIDAEIA